MTEHLYPKKIREKILEDINRFKNNPVSPSLAYRVSVLEAKVDEMHDVLRKIYEVVKE